MNSGLAQSGEARPERKRSDLDILDSCISLLKAANHGQTRNPPRTHGAAEFFLFDGSYDRSLVHQDDGGVTAEGPDDEGKHRVRCATILEIIRNEAGSKSTERTSPVKEV